MQPEWTMAWNNATCYDLKVPLSSLQHVIKCTVTVPHLDLGDTPKAIRVNLIPILGAQASDHEVWCLI